MRSLTNILLTCLVLMMAVQCRKVEGEVDEKADKKALSIDQLVAKKQLRHVVLFKFKDDAPAAEVQKINEAFNALPKEISVIKDFEWGLNDSPEDFHQGFTHCYMLTFDSEEDRDSIYAPHHKHKAFGASLQPYLEKVFVVDYWTNP